MRVAVAADHAGVGMNDLVIDDLRRRGHDVLDLGGHDPTSADDYPDFAALIGDRVSAGDCERGVLICGSGVGASVAANKIKGVRAGLCHDTYSAHQGVEHDDMNVLCLGSEVIGPSLAADLVRAFLAARFDGGERYVARLEKVNAMERGMRDG